MHMHDIDEAFDDGDLAVLQHAFHVLIVFPNQGHVEGARLVASLDRLFDRVTSALLLDHAPLPEHVRIAIQSVTSVPLDEATTYAHAAMIAAEFRQRWHSLFRDCDRRAA